MPKKTSRVVVGTLWVLSVTFGCVPDRPGARQHLEAGGAELVRTSRVNDPSGVADSACRVEEVDRYPLVLPGGSQIYVEPQAIQPWDGGFLIAGSPSYEWVLDESGRVSRAGEGHIVGAFVRDGSVEAVARPPGLGVVGWVRVAPLEAGRWAWLLEEIVRPASVGRETIRIVYAESHGTRWVRLEDLPQPESGQLSFPTSSPLVSTPEGLAWVVPLHAESGSIGALVYELSTNALEWKFESVAIDWVDEVGLYRSASSGLGIAVGGLDEDLGSRQASLRIHHRDMGTTPRKLFRAQPGERIRSLRFVETDEGVAGTWLVVGDGGASSWAVVDSDSDSDDAAPVRVEGSVITSIPVRVSATTAVSVVHHYDHLTGTQELRLYRLGSRPEMIGSFAHPFLGYFGAVAGTNEQLMIVGPDFDPMAVDPFVRSLVLRLSVSCT